VPESVLGVVGEVGEGGLVDVEHPDLLAVAGELEALGVGDGLVDDDGGVTAVVATRACSGRRSPRTWPAPSSTRSRCVPPRLASSCRTPRRRAPPAARRSPAAAAARG
ncbi:Os05g0192200, partial [Oryza sativa Japonica Group]